MHYIYSVGMQKKNLCTNHSNQIMKVRKFSTRIFRAKTPMSYSCLMQNNTL